MVFQFFGEELDRLRGSSRGLTEFTIARYCDTFAKLKPPTACLVFSGEGDDEEGRFVLVVDSVVLGMSSDEAHESNAVRILEAYDQAIPLPVDVEYYAVAAYDVYSAYTSLPNVERNAFNRSTPSELSTSNRNI